MKPLFVLPFRLKMLLKSEQERIKAILKDTITLMCKNGLTYDSEFSVEALIGITLDNDKVFLVSINETVASDTAALKNELEEECNSGIGADTDPVMENEGLSSRVVDPSYSRHRSRKKRRYSEIGSVMIDSTSDNIEFADSSNVDSKHSRLSQDSIYIPSQANNSNAGADSGTDLDKPVVIKTERDNWTACSQKSSHSLNLISGSSKEEPSATEYTNPATALQSEESLSGVLEDGNFKVSDPSNSQYVAVAQQKDDGVAGFGTTVDLQQSQVSIILKFSL